MFPFRFIEYTGDYLMRIERTISKIFLKYRAAPATRDYSARGLKSFAGTVSHGVTSNSTAVRVCHFFSRPRIPIPVSSRSRARFSFLSFPFLPFLIFNDRNACMVDGRLAVACPGRCRDETSFWHLSYCFYCNIYCEVAKCPSFR